MTPLRVVLVSPRNPLNIGAAARAMSNFGFLDLGLVNAYDVAFREAKSAVGAGDLLLAAREYTTVSEAVADCTLVVGTTAASHRELKHTIHRLERGASLIQEAGGGRVALLFGSEKFGLSNEDMSHCHWLMQIPSRPEHRSMNLGQAVAVCLYELIRDTQKASTAPAAKKAASTGDQEMLLERMMDALTVSGYFEGSAGGSQVRMRNLIRRLNLNAQDAKVWLGMFRQILWKLKSD